MINNHLSRARGGKVSFTHLIGYALVKALKTMPEMNVGFDVIDGKPTQITPAHINLGLAIDSQKKDGTRQLLVPNIKGAETMDFAAFWTGYEDIVRKARDAKLTVDDFAGTTVSLTNPGTIGTNHSVPRLMRGQGAIIGVGAMEYPPEYQGASEDTIARNAISRVMTLTSTYDHRVIQGAQSGEFLKRIHALLLGEDGFYDEIFRALRIPYEPIRWKSDIAWSHDDEISKQARILELIHAYRVRGHLMADTDPLEYRQRSHPDLEIETHGLTMWDLDREFAAGSFGGEGRPFMKLRNILGILRDSYCRTTGHRVHAHHGSRPAQRRLDSCFGNALFKRAAADQDFLDTLEAHLKGTRGMALFRAWGLIDYGRSLLRVAAISFGLAAFYGVIYRVLSAHPRLQGQRQYVVHPVLFLHRHLHDVRFW